METLDLFPTGVEPTGSPLEGSKERALRLWWKRESAEAVPFAREILAIPETEWSSVILGHRANRHAWHEHLAEKASADEVAAFVMESVAPPRFLLLAIRALHAQVGEAGRLWILRAIEQDQMPIPWADQMQRLAHMVKAKAPPGPGHGHTTSDVDRALGLFYGFHCDPWHLVGSLYTTAVLADHRWSAMIAALRRLAVRPRDAEFLLVRSRSASADARSWIESVIVPSVREDLRLQRRLAFGMAACLAITARHLDTLATSHAVFETRKPLTDFVRQAG